MRLLHRIQKSWGLLALAGLCCLGACGERLRAPVASGGVLDLRRWDFANQGSVRLDGEWQFFWRRLVSAGERPDGTIALPATWAGQRVGGRALPGQGFGTYRLRVRLPRVAGRLALRLEDLNNAYRLMVNGSEVATNGAVGTSAEQTRPAAQTRLAALDAAGELELLLQVASFAGHRGGAVKPILLGLETDLHRQHDLARALDVGLIGCLLTLGLFFLCFYLLRRRERPALLFALLCLDMALRSAVEGSSGRLLVDLFPGLPYELLTKLVMLTLLLLLGLLTAYLVALFPGRWAVRLARGSWIVLLVPIGIVLVTTADTYERLLLPVELYAVFVLAPAGLALLVSAVRRRRESAGLVLGAMLFFLVFAVHDVLVDNGLLHTPLVLPFGLLGLMLTQAFVLMLRFARAIAGEERLARELEAKNVELQELDALKDEFLANTAHELRTPVSGMVGLTESVLAREQQLPDESRRDLDLVVGSGRRLGHLINDILDLARLRHRDIKLRPTTVDLQAAVAATLALQAPAARARGLTLAADVPAGLLVHADEDRLQQILHNLVANAVKYTEAGTVSVGARSAEDGMVEVEVQDSGPGIPPDQLETIFEDFTRLDTPVGSGTGLGLGITRQLVELQGGTIRADSSPGAGSSFTFSLPAAEVGAAAPEVTSPRVVDQPLDLTPPPVTDAAHRILVVDDDPVLLQVLLNQLGQEQLAVQGASDGPEALRLIDDDPPDLVLLDVMMPGTSGFEVCRRLRQRHGPSELPVILLTARARQRDLMQGFDCGANDYVTKPFARQELVSRVRAQLALKASCEQLEQNLRLEAELEQRRRRQREAEERAQASQLEAFRYQLQPHFLFNALASIRGALELEPAMGRQMITDLAELCRRILEQGTRQTQPLAEEIETVRLYLAMEQARRGEHLVATVAAEPGLDHVPVPALVLQPLVENAIKHGQRRSSDPLRVQVAAERLGADRVRLQVKNSGRLEAVEGNGVGLDNVRGRLEQTYHGRYTFEIVQEDGWVAATMTLPVDGAGTTPGESDRDGGGDRDLRGAHRGRTLRPG